MARCLRLILFILVLPTTFHINCATTYHLQKGKAIRFPCQGERVFKEPKYPVYLGIKTPSDIRPHWYVEEIMVNPSSQEIEEALKCQFEYNTLFKGVFTGSRYQNADYYLISTIKRFDFPENPYEAKFPSIPIPLAFETEIEFWFLNASSHEEIWTGTHYARATKDITTGADTYLMIQESLLGVLSKVIDDVVMLMQREFPEQQKKPEEEKEPITAAPQQQQEQQMQQQMMGPTIVITGGQTATGQQAVEIKEYGIVSFESIPTGAEVYEGTYFLGNAPISKLKFQAGPHSITISMPGYKPWVRQLMVIVNSDVNIRAELEESE